MICGGVEMSLDGRDETEPVKSKAKKRDDDYRRQIREHKMKLLKQKQTMYPLTDEEKGYIQGVKDTKTD